MAIGASPVVIGNGVACEMEPTGREIIRGIQAELKAAELPGYTSYRFHRGKLPHSDDSGGMTVVGFASRLRMDPGEAGDLLLCFGRPKVGAEVGLEGDPELFSYQQLKWLLAQPQVREISPCGSKGIAWEGRCLAQLRERTFSLFLIAVWIWSVQQVPPLVLWPLFPGRQGRSWRRREKV